MSATADCSCVCPTPAVVKVPGTDGADGAAGAAGVSSYSILISPANSLPIPANLGTVTNLPISETAWMAVGQNVFVEGAGYFRVVSKSVGIATLLRLDVPANLPPVGNFAINSVVTAAGPEIGLGALPANITDNSTGTSGTTITGGAGVHTLTFGFSFAGTGAGTGAIVPVNGFIPGYKFKVLSWSMIVTELLVGASGTRTFNLDINGTDNAATLIPTVASHSVVGTVVGAVGVAGANTGSETAYISIESVATANAITAGKMSIMLKIQNMDTADAIATLANRINSLINTTLA